MPTPTVTILTTIILTTTALTTDIIVVITTVLTTIVITVATDDGLRRLMTVWAAAGTGELHSGRRCGLPVALLWAFVTLYAKAEKRN